MKFANITLELSAKAFPDTSDETAFSKARTMFRQWKKLTDNADQISVLLWISDGSEILEYTGNMNSTFEWAYWIGCATPIPPPPDLPERMKRNIFYFPKKYRDDACARPYAWLKRLLEILREVSMEINGKKVRIGAIFDNGPEFAHSDFKYNRHPEMLMNYVVGQRTVVCDSLLHSDTFRYAAYPDGIPEGLSFGHFLGAQFKKFAEDFGYDYIWLSNGIGFGHVPWSMTGTLFDKTNYFPEKADKAVHEMLGFWKDFTDACPGVAIETRGSNYSAGVEMASDGAPLKELYRQYKIMPPVNSPWAALNFNTGLELAAWMSHIAELPDERFPFRFYIHDPWYLNSPWLDRYGRQGWDVFAPLSISRIDENGVCRVANSLSLITVDDSYGRMPEQVPNEVVPLLMDAFENAPDAPGPLIWVYPFEEYADMVEGPEKKLDALIAEDLFLGESLQGGLPLNTVVSTENFRKIEERTPGYFRKKILLFPISAVERNMRTIESLLKHGADFIFYGSAKYVKPELFALLGLKNAEPKLGKGVMIRDLLRNTVEHSLWSKDFYVYGQFECGGLGAVPAPEVHNLTVIAEAEIDREKRICAATRQLENGSRVSFVNTMLPLNPDGKIIDPRELDRAKPSQAYPSDKLLLQTLPFYGWDLHFDSYTANTVLPRTNISRHDNAFFFSIYAKDTSCVFHISTPYGAPLLFDMETRVEHSTAVLHPSDRSWHKECRLFVKQNQCAVLSSQTSIAAFPEYQARIRYENFSDAEIRFFPPRGTEKNLEILLQTTEPFWERIKGTVLTPEWLDEPDGTCVLLRHVTGNLYFAW